MASSRNPEDVDGAGADCDIEEKSPGTQKEGKKRKRKSNRRKAKNKGQDALTNELLNNLDTDDLVDFINNGSSKKEDLKRQPTASTKQGASEDRPPKGSAGRSADEVAGSSAAHGSHDRKARSCSTNVDRSSAGEAGMKAQSQAPGRAGEAEEDSDAADSEAELDSQIKAFAESLE